MFLKIYVYFRDNLRNIFIFFKNSINLVVCNNYNTGKCLLLKVKKKKTFIFVCHR